MQKTILITNDDGIYSPGIEALQRAVSHLGKTVIVAPEQDNSAVSHAITMSRPLKIKDMGENRYAIDGTPTDCVVLGVEKILQTKPDLILSGINNGPNLGDDISYSGTVSAAIEGTMYSIPSIAISHNSREIIDYSKANTIITTIVQKVLKMGLPENTLVNVNIPENPKGFKITRQGRRLWQDGVKTLQDPFGRTCYWLGGGTPQGDSRNDTDVWAVNNGYISVTPIHLDLTNHEGVIQFKNAWDLEEIKIP